MNVRKHRIAAVTILVGEILGLVAWGRSMAHESAGVRAVRDRIDGHWLASAIEVGGFGQVEGARAAACSAVFDGKTVAFRDLVGGINARGTYYIESSHPGWIDLKLDAGWIVGRYQLEGDTLTLCLNPFAPPEQLGVPTLPRPRRIDPSGRRFVYVFQRGSGIESGR